MFSTCSPVPEREFFCLQFFGFFFFPFSNFFCPKQLRPFVIDNVKNFRMELLHSHVSSFFLLTWARPRLEGEARVIRRRSSADVSGSRVQGSFQGQQGEAPHVLETRRPGEFFFPFIYHMSANQLMRLTHGTADHTSTDQFTFVVFWFPLIFTPKKKK